MREKSSLTIGVIAGGYLAYIGGKLILDVWKEQPDNLMIYIMFGVLFVICGGGWCIRCLIKTLRHEYEDPFEEEEEEITEDSVIETEQLEQNTEEDKKE